MRIKIQPVAAVVGVPNATGMKTFALVRESDIQNPPEYDPSNPTTHTSPMVLKPGARAIPVRQLIAQDKSGSIMWKSQGNSGSKSWGIEIAFDVNGLSDENLLLANASLTDQFVIIGTDMMDRTAYVGLDVPVTAGDLEGGAGEGPASGDRGMKYKFSNTSKYIPMRYDFEYKSLFLPRPLVHDAGSITASGFEISWNAIEGVQDFIVTVSTTSDMKTPVAGLEKVLVNAATSYAVTGLTASTKYYFAVKAKDADYESFASDVFEVTTLA